MQQLVLLVSLLVVWFSAATEATGSFTCSIVQSANVTSPNVASPKYLFTPGDCCQYCSQVEGCVAATYVDYLCSPKGSNETVAAPASLTIVVTHDTPTPAPSTAAPTTRVPPTPRPTTVAPTMHPTSTHQPTTQRPTTVPPTPTPQPSTAQPLPPPQTAAPNSMLLVSDSKYPNSTCQYFLNNTCDSVAVQSGSCQQREDGNSEQFVCLQGSVVHQRFNTDNCSGGSDDTLHTLGTCAIGDDGMYHEWECLEISTISSYLVSRTTCPQLDPPSSCTDWLFASGDCVRDGAQRLFVLCSMNHVWVQEFNSTTCVNAAPSMSSTRPLGVFLWSESSSQYVQWNCSAQ